MRLRNFLLTTGLVICFVSFGFAVSEASAGSGQGVEAAVRSSTPLQVDDSTCLACHNKEGFSVELDSGETLPLTISSDAFAESTHGSNGVTCVTCHSDIDGFPHPERTTETIRDVKLKYYTSCEQCHAEQFDKTLDSVHQKALAGGNKNAAVCADCHNPHTQQRLTNKETGAAPSICPPCISLRLVPSAIAPYMKRIRKACMARH